ncbi:MAG: aldo/keto reductase, partial [Nitrospinota bacterium]
GHQNLRRTLEKRLSQLGIDYIDVFLFLGITNEKHFTGHISEELFRFRKEGKVRCVGISTHDRKLAGKLASEGAIDIIMIRYNASHRGAEQDIFPYLNHHNPGVVSYSATRWQRLLQKPPNWPEGKPIPTAGMCYRFVLSNPYVHVCLTAPSNLKQLEENLSALQKGALCKEELEFMRKFGDAVYRAPYKEMFNEKLTSFKMTIKHLFHISG